MRRRIVVLKRGVKGAKIEGSDRIFWILMRRMLDTWRDTLISASLECKGESLDPKCPMRARLPEAINLHTKSLMKLRARSAGK